MAAGRVAIIGGGIAGLAAAYRLRQADSGLALTLVEADTRLGGKIRTERMEGLVIEAGPDSFLASKPAAAALCEVLGLGDRIVSTTRESGGTYILHRGRLEPLPEGITMLVPTKVRPLLRSRLLSTRGKLRLATEYFRRPRLDDADESVASFVRRRFGDEVFDHMAQPLLSGIYAGDAEQLSLLATFPRLRETELRYGSLIRGMLAQRRAAPPPPPGGGQPRGAFLSLRDGLGELIDALVASLDGIDWRVGVAAVAVEPVNGGWIVHLADGSAVAADAVLLATPAWATADLVAGIDEELAELLRGIPYVSTATISLAYRREDVGQVGVGRGFVIPRIEGRELTAVTWASSKFPHRAPEDLVLLRAFVGSAGREEAVDLPDDQLLDLVRRELREILGMDATPVLTYIHRWYRALPQYVLGHLERVEAIDRRLEQHPGLLLLGAAYRGVGIPDCIVSGERAAARALAYLAGAAEPSRQPQERAG
ncbi:MAG: protoporphyrinogen oxidase [Sphaerobacter thermophilus]|uniref:protoporphyrinogen oxidase n=2 Tax=Sphaerobacter thermophilus TaxID=2057 RepID=UPI000DB5A327|nr:MAG: protoporphyrinogen oxidase [Sphaerobacter thermophilus]